MEMHLKNINPTKLSDELIASGVSPILIENDRTSDNYIAENTWITFDDKVDLSLVQPIIDAHDPTPLPQLPTEHHRIAMLEDTVNFLLGL